MDAQKLGGVQFLQNRKVFCPAHAKDAGKVPKCPPVDSFAKYQRMYVARDESKELECAIESGASLRRGALIVKGGSALSSIDYTRPGYHNSEHIFPKNFEGTRVYWDVEAPRKR